MIFRIKNIYISISTYFIILLLWVIFSGKTEAFLICLISLILHELGHIFFVYLYKEKICIFYIIPFGFCCRLKNQSKIKQERMLKIALAGPVTSLIAAGLSFIIGYNNFGAVNLIIGIFNLLPLGMLDGRKIYCKL